MRVEATLRRVVLLENTVIGCDARERREMNSEIRNGFPWIPLLHRVTFYGKFVVCGDAWLDKARSGLEYAEVQRAKRMSRFLVSLIYPREFQINLAFEVILNEDIVFF